MTACTNHGGKARRVVTAALVGVLSVGTVPMVALATGADTTDGIETMAAEWYTGAKVYSATDGRGVTLTGDLSTVTLPAGTGKYLLPTAVQNSLGDVTEVDLNTFKLLYFNNLAKAQMYTTGAGNYSDAVAAAGKVSSSWGDASAKFKALGADTYYVVIENDADGTMTSPIAFKLADQGVAQGVTVKGALTYNGTALNPTAFVDENGDDVTTSGTVKYYDALGHEMTTSGNTWKGGQDPAGTNAVVNAGDYVAEFTGTDGNAYKVPFTVAKLDLSTASVYYADTDTPATNGSAFVNDLKINGKDVDTQTGLSGKIVVTKVVSPDGTGVLGVASGNYEVTVAVASPDANMTGSATVSFCHWDVNGAAQVKYGNKPVTGTLSISLADGESFDASKLSLVGANGVTYKGDQLEVTYHDGSKAVDAGALASKGFYTVTLRVKPFQQFEDDKWVGGSAQISVDVIPASVSTNNMAFYIDGEIVTSADPVTYDGSDWLERIDAVVKDSEGNTMTEGTDYEVEVTKGGKEVDSIVDAGVYQLKIEGITFNPSDSNDTLIFQVLPVDLYRLVADVDSMELPALKNGYIPVDEIDDQNPDTTGTDANLFYVKYTGSAVEFPAVKYQVSNAAGTSFSYVTLDPSLYNVVSIEKGGKVVEEAVEEAVEEGTYTVTIALSDEAKSNYTLLPANSTFEFTVKAYGHFVDVNPEAWYAQAVEDAWYQLYVNGVGGTNVFMPETKITRADAVGIIFNMAGGVAEDDFHFDETGGYVTGFEDVDGHAYYAKAIAWAEASGIVNGHNGQFRPTDDITREEFAAMLANYAKATGKFVASDGSALAGLSDASSVSSWAQESVAWAVENKVMGNGGFVAPQDDITRAEVAAMAVNYQPENLEGLNRDNLFRV